MKKSSAVLLFLILSLGVAQAQDWGVESSTGAGITASPNLGLSLGQYLQFWYEQPFGSSGSGFDAKAHLSLVFDGSNTQKPLIFSGDLDLLQFYFAWKAQESSDSYRLNLGRIQYSDPSGLVFNGSMDGFSLGGDFKDFSLGFTLGYTGLLLKETLGLLVSKADMTRYQDQANWFGSNRIIAAFNGTIPDVFGQKIDLGFTMQQDLNPASVMAPYFTHDYDPQLGGPFNSQYSTLASSALILDNLAYGASFTWESGSTFTWTEDPEKPGEWLATPKPIQAFLLTASLEYFMPEFLNGAFSLNLALASGDADASSTLEGNTLDAYTLFTPLTGTTFGVAYNPGLSNLFALDLGGTVQPLGDKSLVSGLRLYNYFRPVQGSSGAPGVSSDSKGAYIGTEIDISATYNLALDSSVSLSGGLFFPGKDPAGAFPAIEKRLYYALLLSFNLSM